MQYICHRDYEGITESGKNMKISRGDVFPVIGVRIAKDNASICVTTSEISHMYFAINDDNQGLTRGDLTYAIAYSPREKEHSDGHIFRFSEEEIEMITKDYKHFLKQNDPILFNHDFFTADINELKELANKLDIRW